MEAVITNKIEGINLDKLMDLYEESNRENLSMVESNPGEKTDKNILYQKVRESYKAYIKNEFLKEGKNRLAILIDGEKYLAGLRIYDEGKFYLLEALETNTIYRRMGYGERLVRQVVKSLEKGKEIRVEVSLSNKTSLAFHKKVGFKPKTKEENHWVLSIRG
ncbi:GNAT family N-acetyltransferase [uncultured Anaerococcus sp.]|uniref:GNAT family N-acetyltransferase n=1 Tax=uncultured Anaerococcus sp. TaxID=293428 RepID=UPI00288A1725|nr:GNAT family N-acetyltransferase [uncultured Anaerococcus sp.]